MKSKTNWSFLILGGLTLVGCAIALKEEEKKPVQPALLPTEDDIIKRKYFSLSGPSDQLNKPFIVKNETNTYFPLTGKTIYRDPYHGPIPGGHDANKTHQDGHWGIDLYSSNLDIYFPEDGIISKIIIIGKTYGNAIYINTLDNTERWLLAHLEQFPDYLFKSEGKIVKGGTYAGKMGRTGLVTGVHLHIALQRFNSKYGWYNVDPTKRLGLS